VLLDVLVIYSFNDSPVDLYLDFSRFINNFIWNDNNIASLLHQKFESLHIELKASNGSIAEDNYAKADRRCQDSTAELSFGNRKDGNESRDQDLGPLANAKVP
jgi:hypothetical protein